MSPIGQSRRDSLVFRDSYDFTPLTDRPLAQSLHSLLRLNKASFSAAPGTAEEDGLSSSNPEAGEGLAQLEWSTLFQLLQLLRKPFPVE